MDNEVREYMKKYPSEIKELFGELRTLIFSSVSNEIEEKLWAKLPSYYVGENFVRLIPFKDHINIEAKVVALYKEELDDYKMTPKGMLQIFRDQNIPQEILLKLFRESLLG